MKWTGQAIIRAGVFVVLLAVMVALPLLQISEGADRFGWRMFSQVRPLPDFVVVDGSGIETSVAPVEFTAALRGDIPFETALPPHLCSVFPGTVTVRIVARDSKSEFRCP